MHVKIMLDFIYFFIFTSAVIESLQKNKNDEKIDVDAIVFFLSDPISDWDDQGPRAL